MVGQVRTQEKVELLSKLVVNLNLSFDEVPVIEEKGAFNKFLRENSEVECFFHTAYPVSFSTKNLQKTILLPAIYGTKYVLKSLKEYAPQLEHFVYTLSAIT